MQAERKTEKQSKTQETAYRMKIAVPPKLKNELHLFERSFISNTLRPEAPAFLFSPIKVDCSCEHSDTLGGESAAGSFYDRDQTWCPGDQSAHHRQVRTSSLLCGGGPSTQHHFPSQKCFNVLIKDPFQLLQADLLSVDNHMYLILFKWIAIE